MKFSFLLLVILALLSVIYILLLSSSEKFLTSSFCVQSSCEIIINYEDAFLFGPQEIHIYYKFKNDLLKQKLLDTEINNDGADLLPGINYSINWNKTVGTITFKGEEQGYQYITIDTKNKSTIKKYEDVYK
ncbi:hypothetical protein [Tepidibacter hydrothermalis]|uniref:Lipoprotein n=1 Tax=Tepidibacter hydrothermalis TaxID=3036126 RepID=A0ABY8E8U0_9FIRM|nr:hypothetical protein [Tepidibacter hydrothermalis]WFD09292.1 hypothetical protein P4S50_12955 [Tepidibacter hydrothermalis]